jgi:hypothetical protein
MRTQLPKTKETKPMSAMPSMSKQMPSNQRNNKPAPTKRAEASSRRTPSHEEIARRAYHLFLARGRKDGHDREDWIRAEQELMKEMSR